MIDIETMRPHIKLAIRHKSDTFDDQIDDCVRFVEQDLADLNFKKDDWSIENNPRLRALIILYAKSVFNYENKADWYLKQYERLRNQMSMQSKYRGGTVNE